MPISYQIHGKRQAAQQEIYSGKPRRNIPAALASYFKARLVGHLKLTQAERLEIAFDLGAQMERHATIGDANPFYFHNIMEPICIIRVDN